MTIQEVEQEIIKTIETSIQPLDIIDLIILLCDEVHHDVVKFYNILSNLVKKKILEKKSIDCKVYYLIYN